MASCQLVLCPPSVIVMPRSRAVCRKASPDSMSRRLLMASMPIVPSYEMWNLPLRPFFVATAMTPAAPRDPYCAVSEASLRIVKLSMSAG